MSQVEIDVKHITRVEGHGNIRVSLQDGEITRLELAIVESPRFFESFLRGRRYDEAPTITCRVCGICSIGHTTASLKAVEAACGIEVSAQTVTLRKLAFMGEQLQSHLLHLYFLAVPDYLGVGSVIPLAATHLDVVKRALRMKKLANDICGVVAGRHIHPIAMRVGGFTHLPDKDALRDLKRRLEAARDDWAETVALFATIEPPPLQRETDYVALCARELGEYAFYDGQIVSTKDPRPTAAGDYRQRVSERVVQHSAAKHCCNAGGEPYSVGALARFNNNHESLHPAAKSAAARLKLVAPCHNPFHNNTAQLVEVVHCSETALELIEQLLQDELRPEPLVPPARFGSGVGAAEVPRGLLFHEYNVDQQGRIDSANLIIPTGQNLANIEEDMRALVPRMLEAGLDTQQMTQRLEMLVRAYDPCISCATHFLDIEWR